MHHKIFNISYIRYLLYAFVSIFAAQLHANNDAPNIIFILVDDQRNDTLGCAGHSVIRTPNIDLLAREGTRFENAFVTMPICMASRATIFTGLTHTSHGFTGGNAPAIPLQKADVDTSFPIILRKAGYRSGFYGKQHVKFAERNNVALARMFDDYKVYNGGPHFVKLDDGTRRHSAEIIGDNAVNFINTKPNEKPFFLYISFNIAHAVDHNHNPGAGHFPWPKAVDGMYEDIVPAAPALGDPKYFEMQPDFLKKSLNRYRWFWRWDTPEKYKINMRAYYRMLSGMDKVIGRVQKELVRSGLDKNTILIYTADNGFYMGERGFAGKWSHYEESLRVPMIIYDPRPVANNGRGKVCSEFVTNLDLPSTILNISGTDIPEKYQGSSLVPFVYGKQPDKWRKDFYCEFRSSHGRLPNWKGVRTTNYSYARYIQEEPVVEVLYDLKKDPQQLSELSDDPTYTEVLKQMREKTNSYVKMYTRPEIEQIRSKALQKASTKIKK